MKVELIAYTKPVNGEDKTNPMDIVEQCASVCYDSKPTENYRIAKSCHDSGHHSVFEHINFTFYISGVSRALLAQLSRHRHISLSVRSQRYNNESNFEYVMPKEISMDEHDENYFMKGMNKINEWYNTMIENGIKPEDARAILPNACCTELYMTANARALIEMSYLRLCNRAQDEIRTMFQEIKKQVATVCPEVAEYMVPKCEKNPDYPFCNEKKSCGRHNTLKDKHGIIPLYEIKNMIKNQEESPRPVYFISNDNVFPGTLCNQGWSEFEYEYDDTMEDEIKVFIMGWDCYMCVKLSEYNKTWFAYYEKPEKDEVDAVSSN